MVFAGDECSIGPWTCREKAEDFGKGGKSRKAFGIGSACGADLTHVGVGRDDIDIALVEGRDSARTTPVDEMRG